MSMEEIISKLQKIGINHSFNENPGFVTVVNTIHGLMSGFDWQEATVNEKQNSISYEWFDRTSKGNKTIEMMAASDDAKSFSCLQIQDDILPPSVDIKKSKSATEIVCFINESFDLVVSIRTVGIIYTKNEYSWGADVYSNITDLIYDNYGIMKKKESKEFPKSYFATNFDDLEFQQLSRKQVSEMLDKLRLVIENPEFSSYRCISTLTRDKLDTALFKYEEDGSVVYDTLIPLDTEHGLRDMYPCKGPISNFIIPPRTNGDIANLIQRESAIAKLSSIKYDYEKVIEGLKQLSEGRTTEHQMKDTANSVLNDGDNIQTEERHI